MALSLDQLIESLVAIRDAHPSFGSVTVTTEDSELGADYPNDITAVVISPGSILLTLGD
jgi:hypothetical protein